MIHKFIAAPNLPEGKVKLLLLGIPYRHILEESLSELEITPVWLPKNTCADPRLQGHADLMALYMGNGKIVCVPGIANLLTRLNMHVIPVKSKLAAQYPNDCLLNGCLLGHCYIHRLDVTDPSVRINLDEIQSLDVKQAYTKCSTCVVHSNAIITSDPGISKIASSHNIDVLTIRPGYIELPGYKYGFIGGATFKIAKNILAFTGTFDHHPDHANILNFLRKHNVQPLCLTTRTIFDIGSAIPISEH